MTRFRREIVWHVDKCTQIFSVYRYNGKNIQLRCDCFYGWNGTSCEIPISTPQCVNGVAVGPDMYPCRIFGWKLKFNLRFFFMEAWCTPYLFESCSRWRLNIGPNFFGTLLFSFRKFKIGHFRWRGTTHIILRLQCFSHKPVRSSKHFPSEWYLLFAQLRELLDLIFSLWLMHITTNETLS